MKTSVGLLSSMSAAMVVLIPFLAATDEPDWPLWSGPSYDLTSPGGDVFRGDFRLDLQWASPLGSGYSGIAVVDDQVITAFSDGESDFLAAFAAGSGDELWRYRIAETYEGHDQSEDGPLATPTIHDGRVFILGPWGHLVALRLDDGERLWSRHVVDDLGAREPFAGFASAPTVIGGVLVIQAGGSDGRSICGLDPATGHLLWSAGDDFVMYQSPVAVRVGDEELIFAVTDESVVGLRPRTGEVLWQLLHELSGDGFHGVSQPVRVDASSVLLNGWTETALYRVTGAGGGFRAAEIWRTRSLRSSLAASVPYEGYIYGYGGRFLTCVDAQTGERVWRSRAPGPGTLILVDGHLVVLTRTGELVVAEASSEGFHEKARARALEHGYFTRPSFAGGRIFVRNLDQIASIGVARAASSEAREAPELLGKIGELVRDVAAATEKSLVVDGFLAAHAELPILDGNIVHFVYRGEVDDLGLGADFFPAEKPMYRIEGTDLFFRSVLLEPAARFEYYYSVFGQIRVDPFNPRRTDVGGMEVSVLTTRGWEEPPHLRAPAGSRGRIETLTWDSESLGYEREVQVYLPPGYDESTERFGLLVVHGGDQALARGHMDRSLDNLVGRTVAPLIVAFVPEAHWSESMSSGIVKYSRALGQELIRRLDTTYRTIARPEARGVMGAGAAAVVAIYATFERPGLFGKLATQSLYMRDLEDDVHELIASSDGRQLDLYIEWSRHDLKEYSRIDARAESQAVVKALEKKGYRPVAHEAPGGSGWGGWRQRNDRVLEALFPLD